MNARLFLITLMSFSISKSNLLPQTRSEYFASLEQLISKRDIEKKIAEAGQQLNAVYAGKSVTIIMVMTGAVCVVSELMQALDVPCKLKYIKASSYGSGMTSGDLTIVGLEDLNIEGEHIVLVDDIFDTGKTLTTLRTAILEKNPASVKTLVLLTKNVNRPTDYQPDYTLFNIADHFVVGYGLDYKNHYRGLPGIYVLKNIPG